MKKHLFSILALLCMTAASAMAQDPSIPVQQEDLSWEFTMPAANKLLMVEYFPSTLTLETNDIAMGTVEVVKESGVAQLTVPESWSGVNDNVTADDLPGFKNMTKEEAMAWTGAPQSGKAILIYHYDGIQSNYISYENGNIAESGDVSSTWSRAYMANPALNEGAKFYYSAAILPEGVTDNGNGTYSVEDGTEVTIKATAAKGNYMDMWLDDQGMEITDGNAEFTDFLWNSSLPQNGTLTLSMGLDDRYVMADFLQAGYVVSVPAHEFVTYYADKTVTLPTMENDIQLYTVSSVGDTEVTLTSAIDVANTETPLLIYNYDGEAKDVLLITNVGTPANIAVANVFHGTLTDRTFTAEEMAGSTYYVCNGKQFVPVKTAGTIAANRCWLQIGSIAEARALNIVIGDEATGITDANATANDADFYDLNGRKVQSLKKGVYISNGKKVVIK